LFIFEQKIPIWEIFRLQNVDIFYGHLEYISFTVSDFNRYMYVPRKIWQPRFSLTPKADFCTRRQPTQSPYLQFDIFRIIIRRTYNRLNFKIEAGQIFLLFLLKMLRCISAVHNSNKGKSVERHKSLQHSIQMFCMKCFW
jgi:hypothetical protein